MITTAQITPHTRCTRTRLLNSLGLFREDQQKHQQQQPKKKEIIAARHLSTRLPRLVFGNTFQEKLKSHNDSSISTQIRRSSNGGGGQQHQSGTTNRRKISFEETVSVIQIPSRHAYSTRIKKFLWNDSNEIREMAQRNYKEFEAEGFDYRNVVLDEDMFVDSINGGLIHPCHLSDDCFVDSTAFDDDGFVPLSRQNSFIA